MLILAFESSAKAASVALVRDGRLLSQSIQVSGLTHSRTLLPMVVRDLCFVKRAFLRLADQLFSDVGIADHHCFVAVILFCLHLKNSQGTSFEHGYRNEKTSLIEDLGHSDFCR